MNRKVLVLLAVLLFMFGTSLLAHHSQTAAYHEDQTIQIKGKIVQFMFRNPHSWVSVMAPDDKGAMQRWGIEWGGAGQLGGQGVTRETLKPGDEVVVTGAPGRGGNPDHRLLMRTLKRTSDGFGWGTRSGEVVD